MSDPDRPDDEDRGPGSRFRRLGRRILGEGEAAGRFSPREVVGAVLEGSDKAKTEVVRVIAREVRNYLEELGLREVLTDYSLEMHVSLNLRRLAEEDKLPPVKRRRAEARPEPKGEAKGEARAEPKADGAEPGGEG